MGEGESEKGPSLFDFVKSQMSAGGTPGGAVSSTKPSIDVKNP